MLLRRALRKHILNVCLGVALTYTLIFVPEAHSNQALWLITPEEAAMRAASEPSTLPDSPYTDVGQQELDAGPLIEIFTPKPGGRHHAPVEVIVRFVPRSEAVDLESLKIVLVKFLSIDITERIRPYVSLSGIEIKEAQIPSGKHTVRISIADKSGGLTAKEISFEVM